MWKIKPMNIESMSKEATHVAFFDENGDTDMSYIVKCKHNGKTVDISSRYFCLTSILLQHDDVEKVSYDITELKRKYWPDDGCFQYGNGKYQKVVLHSREIRRRTGPFSKNVIKGDLFMNDLSSFIESLPISITSSFIDKMSLYDKYGEYARSPYDLSIKFILERMVGKQLKDTDKIIIILESRGKVEDYILLDTIMRIKKYGTEFMTAKRFDKIIGVYFNPKRSISDCRKSYYGLEIADLCSYPIYKYCRNGSDKTDKAYEILKSKIYGFPNIKGYGLKMFP